MLSAGDAITLKLPVDTDKDVLEYINRNRSVTRNKFLSSVLLEACKNEVLKENEQSVTLTLPMKVNEDQRSQLNSRTVVRALAAFAQTIIGGASLSVEPVNTPQETKNAEKTDFSAYEGLIPDDY
jgi:hypothetical protein